MARVLDFLKLLHSYADFPPLFKINISYMEWLSGRGRGRILGITDNVRNKTAIKTDLKNKIDFAIVFFFCVSKWKQIFNILLTCYMFQ